MVPNGVFNSRPPAIAAPCALVWQAMQSPRRATYAPRLICAASGAADQAGPAKPSMPNKRNVQRIVKTVNKDGAAADLAFILTLLLAGISLRIQRQHRNKLFHVG